jgi:hypothetical protein
MKGSAVRIRSSALPEHQGIRPAPEPRPTQTDTSPRVQRGYPGMTQPSQAKHPPAKDLSREDPRPMDASVAGHPWLPRMIDKARAA